MHNWASWWLLGWLRLGWVVASPAVAPTILKVVITQADNDGTTVYCALFDSAHRRMFPRNRDGAAGLCKATVKNHQAQCVFKKVVPGQYALSAYADENGNGTIDMNAWGYPKEKFATSGKASNKRFGRPKFEQAAFVVKVGTNVVVLPLQH